MSTMTDDHSLHSFFHVLADAEWKDDRESLDVQDLIAQDGRSYRLKLSYRF